MRCRRADHPVHGAIKVIAPPKADIERDHRLMRTSRMKFAESL
jgi:hypothetical protein